MEKYYFLNDYAGLTYADVIKDVIYSYQVDETYVNKFFFLVANVHGDGYSESSYFLLLEKSSGKLFEVYGSHCSCYGFEGQFDLEETSLAYLLSDNSNFGLSFDDESKGDIRMFIRTKVRYLKLKELFEEV